MSHAPVMGAQGLADDGLVQVVSLSAKDPTDTVAVTDYQPEEMATRREEPIVTRKVRGSTQYALNTLHSPPHRNFGATTVSRVICDVGQQLR